MRVKICGLTTVADAQFAARAGADALGLVFYKPSPRFISVERAHDIVRSVGPFVTSVGLFVDADADYIHQVLAQVPLACLQFHGDESPEFCQQFNRPYLKALRMREGIDLDVELARYRGAQGILLDAYHPSLPGGTGETFDWRRVPRSSAQHIVLAGGLTPENVTTAINQTQVYGVDVSGGVEDQPGIKNQDKVQAFIANARSTLPTESE